MSAKNTIVLSLIGPSNHLSLKLQQETVREDLVDPLYILLRELHPQKTLRQVIEPRGNLYELQRPCRGLSSPYNELSNRLRLRL